MTRICRINHHANGKYIREVYDVNKCVECGWRVEPQKVTMGIFSFTNPNKCLKTPLKTYGSRVIRNINILPTWCPLPKADNE